MHLNDGLGDGSGPSPHERMWRTLTGFPGPIAVACDPPAGSVESSGGEDVDGLPFSVHVTYRVPAGPKLLVRTKAVPQPLPEPGTLHPPLTIDTLQNAFGIYGHRTVRPPAGASAAERSAWRAQRMADFRQNAAEFEALARTAVRIEIDGVPFAGFRVDYPDCSGIEVDWNGQSVQCVGAGVILDVLALRSAREDDLRRVVSPLGA